jgi:hypothetical protein
MLLNSEVWHSLTKNQVEELEIIDRMLLRNTLMSYSKAAVEWIYLTFIQVRRLMYLWHILSSQDDELIHKEYNTQKVSNSVGDWVRLLNADKDQLGIELNPNP